MMIRRALALSALVLGVIVAAPRAHDLAQSSAVVTVRDTGVLELRLSVPYEDALHASAMPRQPQPLFLATVSSMTDARVAALLDAFQAALQRGTRVVADGRTVPLTSWQWPAHGEVRATIRRASMIATLGLHDHVERLTITASGRTSELPRQVQLQVPAAAGPVLLTVVRPQEQWLRSGALSAPITIR